MSGIGYDAPGSREASDNSGGGKSRVVEATGTGEAKNPTTRGFALSFFRVSLTILVSIKYTRGILGGFHAFKSASAPTSGHRRQHLGKAPPARRGKRAAARISRCSASALCPCAPARSLSARTISSSTPRTNRSASRPLQALILARRQSRISVLISDMARPWCRRCPNLAKSVTFRAYTMTKWVGVP
jgi:hypothetical protein